MRLHNTAVIGCGIWGKNVARNFYNLNALHTICELDEENRRNLKQQYPDVNIISDCSEIFNNPDIDSAAVVTPSHTHYRLVKQALEAGKHVYVEKPISTSAAEAKALADTAAARGLILMTGHLLMYHPAVNRLKMLINDGVLGDVRYIQSDRLNINCFKNDRSVMWDLAPHDVSMISCILEREPLRVLAASGVSVEGSSIMDVTHISIEYEDGITAHISDSWIHPVKRVNLLVRGTKASIVFDDTLCENKLQIFENTSPKTARTEIIDYIDIEPLKLECQNFLSCIETGRQPRSGGYNGFNTVKILEEAEKIMLGDKASMLDKCEFALSRSSRKF